MNRNWIAVASAAHVRLGRDMGFMQVCHGKAAPLRRLRPGDRVIYYSPTERLGERTPLQTFTAVGRVLAGEPYQVDMGNGFCPFRRDVLWSPANETRIAPLLARLEFSAGRKNWGYPFRFGIFGISDHDASLIAAAMGVEA
ncbi:MAG TPA: EVE domain-containing protein [Azonexus sp.]|nr:EVE domain-containing protein [Azonexus sp.]